MLSYGLILIAASGWMYVEEKGLVSEVFESCLVPESSTCVRTGSVSCVRRFG